MPKKQWIWTVSILQLALFVYLIWNDPIYHPTLTSMFESSIEKEFTWDWKEVDLISLPIPGQIAVGLNIPALLIGGLATELIDFISKGNLTSLERDRIVLIFGAVLIPIFWYWVIQITIVMKRTRAVDSNLAKTVLILIIIALSNLAIFLIYGTFITARYSGFRNILFIFWIFWAIYILVLRIKKPSGKSLIKQASQP